MGGILGAVLIAAVLVYVFPSSGPDRQPTEGSPGSNVEAELAIHNHARLRIAIRGQQYRVPKAIGISAELWNDHGLDRFGQAGSAPLHTHDETGMIHIESIVERDYTLGEFFSIWGVELSEECLVDACTQGNEKVRAFANGVELDDPPSYVLRNRDEISLTLE